MAESQAFRFLCLYNTVSIIQSCAVQWFKVSYKLIKTNKMKHAAPWPQCPHFQMSPACMHWIVPIKNISSEKVLLGSPVLKHLYFLPSFNFWALQILGDFQVFIQKSPLLRPFDFLPPSYCSLHFSHTSVAVNINFASRVSGYFPHLGVRNMREGTLCSHLYILITGPEL